MLFPSALVSPRLSSSRTERRATILIDAFDEAAENEVARDLRVLPGTLVTVLKTVGLADGIPVNVSTTFCPSARLPGLAELYREHLSLTSVLRQFGISDYQRHTTRVIATMPTDEQAKLLRQSVRDPVLEVESVDVDAAGTPISFSQVRFAGGRVQLVVDCN